MRVHARANQGIRFELGHMARSVRRAPGGGVTRSNNPERPGKHRPEECSNALS